MQNLMLQVCLRERISKKYLKAMVGYGFEIFNRKNAL